MTNYVTKDFSTKGSYRLEIRGAYCVNVLLEILFGCVECRIHRSLFPVITQLGD